MHDMHLAEQILKIVLEHAEKNNFKQIKKIELELGSILEHGEYISPENLIFNFKLLSKNTSAENAELNIEKVSGDDWKLVSMEGGE
ncbi:MAG TPA: hydrogenase/urease maturation nickel metallochaperone HypA [Candidatus Portnoybacteria bacterium]|jgi:Zn finger protein HypA/HybF involved in hydrogenase expression|nr:hydrogenase/urease maturation nickel metallochaperone HypA [Candidatus Portnoybacteria bacterium]MDD5752192.1 hydrogenase/urease maturation nickel metallochaperone HypA [Candidatus Portnoybacteria bacterium]HOZ16558.1 hydrogenase/urease maturation nickel metallochaperone HypA [Candidatus Portnoybacteria bacterium]HPH52185.1 hydrogenase/urease maturation nickel metallochaperone HypA [Candidatus Portnoybacteria bacterium]HPJ80368.1 hydrogenase/urease maturation nickel metallochaperone HypA [Ca